MDSGSLLAVIIQEITSRNNRESGFFNDTFQALPTERYGKLLEVVLGHRNISVKLNTGLTFEELDCQNFSIIRTTRKTLLL